MRKSIFGIWIITAYDGKYDIFYEISQLLKILNFKQYLEKGSINYLFSFHTFKINHVYLFIYLLYRYRKKRILQYENTKLDYLYYLRTI